MYYPEEIIEEVRQRNDIVEVISSYVRLQKRGANHMGLCPFHNEKSPSFSVSAAKQMYYCFGCGKGGNVFTFLMEYENETFGEAVKALADRAGIHLPEQEYDAEAKKRAGLRSRLLEVNKEAATYYFYQLRSEKGRAAMEYLKGRALSNETIREFGLGFSSQNSKELYRYLKSKGYEDELLRQSGLMTFDEAKGVYDKFWNRVMFPIFDTNSRVIGFGGRVMGDGSPKYLNSPETAVFDKSRNLYGLHRARLSREKYMLVCEGYMDVISLHQAGFTNAVASLGTAFTGLQANLLKRYTGEVVLTYDSDAAGIKAALRAIPMMKEAGITTKVLNMKPYKDPDEFIKALGAEAFRERIREAQNSFYFEISVLEQDYDMQDPESKTKFFQAVARRLLVFADDLERNTYIEAVASRYFIPAEQLRSLVNRLGAGYVNVLPEQAGYTGWEERRERASKKKQTAEEGLKQSQRLLLTWLIERPELFDKLKGVVDENDILEPLYHQAAALLFQEYRETGAVNPARLLSQFESKEEQTEVAALFHTLPTEEELDEKAQEKAFNETIRRIKKMSLEEAAKKASEQGNMERFGKIIQEQARWQKLYISWE